MTIALLTVIAFAEVARLLLTHLPLTRKRHFKNKLRQVTAMLWDLEFKKFKIKEIREGVRREYDAAKSRFHVVEEQLPKEKDAARKGELEDTKNLLLRDIPRLEETLKQYDLELDGSKPTNQYPEGVRGISNEIDSMKELQIMLKDHINST